MLDTLESSSMQKLTSLREIISLSEGLVGKKKRRMQAEENCID